MDMKKRFILALFVCVLLCGCTPVQEMSIQEVIDNGTSRTVSVYNKYRKGYKYNLPKGLDVVHYIDYNETVESKDYTYYLYVDCVSYFNKVIEKYEVSEKAYVSMPISYEDKYGYLEINKLNNGKYFIELMYNYAADDVVILLEFLKAAGPIYMNKYRTLNGIDMAVWKRENKLLRHIAETERNGFTVDIDYLIQSQNKLP